MSPKTKWDVAGVWMALVVAVAVLAGLGFAGLTVWWIGQHWRGVLAVVVAVGLFILTHWAAKIREGSDPRKVNRRVETCQRTPGFDTEHAMMRHKTMFEARARQPREPFRPCPGCVPDDCDYPNCTVPTPSLRQ